MSFGLNKTSASQGVAPAARARAPQSAAEAAPGMAGDSLSLSGAKARAAAPEPMSKEEAAKAISTGGKMLTVGVVGALGATLMSGALASLAGTVLLPAAIGLGAAGLAIWGATKLAGGLKANTERRINEAFKAIE